MYKFIEIKPSTRNDKKFMVILLNKTTGNNIKVHFGAKGMEDYTIHKDKERREAYIRRHQVREDWENPITAGFWSRHILWGDSTSLNTNVNNTIKKYKL